MKPLKELKKDILKYQKTHDKDLFADIIFNLDYLIRYFIRRCKNQYTYLWQVESIDLYQDSIIGLSNSIEGFPAKMPEKYIPCRLKAYMVEEFRKSYSYKMIEFNSADRQASNSNIIREPNGKNVDSINTKEIDYEIMMNSLDKEEREFLNDYLINSGDNIKMSKKHGISGKDPGDKFRVKAGRLIQKRFKK